MTTEVIPPSAPEAAPTSRSFDRMGAASGVVFVVCLVLSLVLVGEMPAASDDALTIADYLTEDIGTHQAGLLFIGIAIVPLTLFLAGLLGVHQRADRRHGERWSVAIATFFVLAIALLSVGVLIDGALLVSRDAGLSDGVLLAVWDISIASGAIMTVAFGAAAASVGIQTLHHGLRPAWYGWLGVIVGILGLLNLGMLVTDSDTAVAVGFAMLPGFIIWVLATSVFLTRDA